MERPNAEETASNQDLHLSPTNPSDTARSLRIITPSRATRLNSSPLCSRPVNIRSVNHDTPSGAEPLYTLARMRPPHTRRRIHDELFLVSPVNSEQDREDSPQWRVSQWLYPVPPPSHATPAYHLPDRGAPVCPWRTRSALEAFGLLPHPAQRHAWPQGIQPIARVWRNQDLHLVCADIGSPETSKSWIHGWEPTIEPHTVREKFKHKQPILARIFSFLRPARLVPTWLKLAVAHAGARARTDTPTWSQRTDGIRILVTPYPNGQATGYDDWFTPSLWLYQINAVVPGCRCPTLHAAGCVTVFQFGRGTVITAEAWLTPKGTLRLCANDSPLHFRNPLTTLPIIQSDAQPATNAAPLTDNPTPPYRRPSYLPIAATSSLIHTIEHQARAHQRSK